MDIRSQAPKGARRWPEAASLSLLLLLLLLLVLLLVLLLSSTQWLLLVLMIHISFYIIIWCGSFFWRRKGDIRRQHVTSRKTKEMAAANLPGKYICHAAWMKVTHGYLELRLDEHCIHCTACHRRQHVHCCCFPQQVHQRLYRR